ncbi:MAG: hypothetical protein OEZ39_20295 [Gammaproteobacteria bacterium]|nr:hypothetical protein [Gammaproteobacteria bacterium]
MRRVKKFPHGLAELPRGVTGESITRDIGYVEGPKKSPRAEVNDVNFINVPFKLDTINKSYQIIPGNKARVYLNIQNKSPAGELYITFNNAANVFTGIIIYSSGGYYEPFVAPGSSVHILGNVANMTGVIIEGVRG